MKNIEKVEFEGVEHIHDEDIDEYLKEEQFSLLPADADYLRDYLNWDQMAEDAKNSWWSVDIDHHGDDCERNTVNACADDCIVGVFWTDE